MRLRGPSIVAFGFIVLLTIVFGLIDRRGNPAEAHFTGGDEVNANSAKCIDVAGGDRGNWAWVLQWTCHSGANQQLRMIDMAPGWHEIRFSHSDKCLDAYLGGIDNGTPLIQYDCNGDPNEQWSAVWDGRTERILNRKAWDLGFARCIDVQGQSLNDGAILHL
jgi:hypothetical protein